ncbi:YjfA family protein [Bacillus halotolerans]|uniref:YjfA family protein n=1 Tax=Bacillus halotolerans TaxID=260554 RepID=UPI002DBD2C77|nr:YjfA family protein [Bacillus halotolerans]MEC1663397.1 YjfA family protein [Bacillus halotolerans]
MKRMVKKVALVLFAFVFIFAIKGAPAHAETHAYDGKSPYYNDCASSATTKKSSNLVNANNQVIGVVELKFSSTCKTAWAKITMNNTLTTSYEANAEITRNTDKKRYNCDSAGGNGKAVAGQKSCYTPMVYDLDPRTSYAFGKYSGPNLNVWATTGSY